MVSFRSLSSAIHFGFSILYLFKYTILADLWKVEKNGFCGLEQYFASNASCRHYQDAACWWSVPQTPKSGSKPYFASSASWYHYLRMLLAAGCSPDPFWTQNCVCELLKMLRILIDFDSSLVSFGGANHSHLEQKTKKFFSNRTLGVRSVYEKQGFLWGIHRRCGLYYHPWSSSITLPPHRR